eukprot:scaffold3152_cov256-Ochromonas_danica.AAC.1
MEIDEDPPIDSDIDILYDLYLATNGDQWTIDDGNPWNFSQAHPNPCEEDWAGVTCSLDCSVLKCQQEIVEISLQYFTLNGTLPESLGNFSALKILDIESSEGLFGTIPHSLANLTTLNTLILDTLSLTGTIPSALSELRNLQVLQLSYLSLSGTIPEAFYSGLSNLTFWYLQSLTLNGNISRNISLMTQLTVLSFETMFLEGTIPAELSQLTSLSYLSLASNSFTGTIPPQLVYNIINLTTFSLSDNSLSGPLPEDWRSAIIQDIIVEFNVLSGTIPMDIYSLTHLRQLSVEYNTLSGTLDTAVGNLSQLANIYIGYSLMNGTLPSSLGKLSYLSVLDASYAFFTGTLPVTLVNCTSLQILSMAKSLYTGPIPAGLGKLPWFNYLDISYNLIEGSIPESFYDSTALVGLLLGTNLLTGTLPNDIGRISNLAYLILDHNLLYGTVPYALSSLTRMISLGLGTNAFTGPANLEWSNFSNLNMLQLQDCLFTGSLSFTAKSAVHFQYVNVSLNYFSGNLSVLSYAPASQVLDISFNLLSGPLPDISSMASLLFLFAQSNFLVGSIENLFSQGVHALLQNVDISNNLLTGSIPSQFQIGTGVVLKSFAAIQNCFTGTIPDSFCNITSLEVLALDGLSTAKTCRSPILSNVFPRIHSYSLKSSAIHGSIPDCLFRMPRLKTLHLAGNGLRGSIPVKEESDLGSQLNDISLSHNLLTGTLPAPLRGGMRWKALDVSYNKLKGELKTSRNQTIYQTGCGFPANASIYLSINRFSGRIPGFYYDMTGGNLDMLRGNMFACPTTDGENDLPRSDSYNQQYDCGSDNLNSSLIVWAGLVFGMIGVLFLVIAYERRRKRRNRTNETTETDEKIVSPSDNANDATKTDCEKVPSIPAPQASTSDRDNHFTCYRFIKSNFFGADLLARWNKVLSLWHESLPDGSDLYNCDILKWKHSIWSEDSQNQFNANSGDLFKEEEERSLRLIYDAGRLLHDIRFYALWLGICMVCVGGPIYVCLTIFSGSYDNEYAWTLSAAYLTGIVAAIVLACYFIILLGIEGILLYRYFRRWKLQEKSLQEKSLQEKLSASSSSVNPLHVVSGHQISVESVTVREHSSMFLSISSISSKFSKEEVIKFKNVLLMKIVILVVNILVVLVVNGFYVYVYRELQRWSAVMLSLALSLFKVGWSMIVQLSVVHWLQPIQQLPLDGDLHKVNMSFMSSLMLFNTIVAPCLATMIASSDCFYYVFASPPAITASYTFAQCEIYANLGCSTYEEASLSTEFSPPFNYGFQCSSAILVDYAYVFAYKYVIIGIVYPFVVLGIALYTDWRRKNGDKRAIWLETLLPSMWRWKDDSSQSSSLFSSLSSSFSSLRVASSASVGDKSAPPSHNSSRSSSSPSSGRLCFSSGDFVIRLTMMLGCLLTFGAVAPFLAVLIGFSIAANTYLSQIGWLHIMERYANRTSTDDQTETAGGEGRSVRLLSIPQLRQKIILLGEQVDMIGPGIAKACRPIVILLPLFYSCYLFDTAGDQGGGLVGLFFVLAFWGFCLLCIFLFFNWSRYTAIGRLVFKKKHVDEKPREDSKGDELGEKVLIEMRATMTGRDDPVVKICGESSSDNPLHSVA